MSSDTIVAIATATTPGAVGVVRVSGLGVRHVMAVVLSSDLTPRHASLRLFHDVSGEVVDQGLAIFFPGPNSFTGEDVLELQGHGGTAVLDRVLCACLSAQCADWPIRLAEPGEFSKRAFLNDRLDLIQAEAVSDLVAARSHAAAKAALLSLQGGFSREVQALQSQLVDLRMRVEACLDFPDEEQEFLVREAVAQRLMALSQAVDRVLLVSGRGVALRDGLRVVLVGPPNVGKSSLLNALAEQEVAIVTSVAGTTRDRIQHEIVIEGITVQLTDTAGIRDSQDSVELLGIDRTWQAVAQADVLLMLRDASDTAALGGGGGTTALEEAVRSAWLAGGGGPQDVWLIHNKADLLPAAAGSTPIEARHEKGVSGQVLEQTSGQTSGQVLEQTVGVQLWVSATTGLGLSGLRSHLRSRGGLMGQSETVWGARRRHLDALEKTQSDICLGQDHLRESELELLAERLRLAQGHLSGLTGDFHSDDLLGVIFGSFCIGK